MYMHAYVFLAVPGHDDNLVDTAAIYIIRYGMD